MKKHLAIVGSLATLIGFLLGGGPIMDAGYISETIAKLDLSKLDLSRLVTACSWAKVGWGVVDNFMKENHIPPTPFDLVDYNILKEKNIWRDPKETVANCKKSHLSKTQCNKFVESQCSGSERDRIAWTKHVPMSQCRAAMRIDTAISISFYLLSCSIAVYQASGTVRIVAVHLLTILLWVASWLSHAFVYLQAVNTRRTEGSPEIAAIEDQQASKDSFVSVALLFVVVLSIMFQWAWGRAKSTLEPEQSAMLMDNIDGLKEEVKKQLMDSMGSIDGLKKDVRTQLDDVKTFAGDTYAMVGRIEAELINLRKEVTLMSKRFDQPASVQFN